MGIRMSESLEQLAAAALAYGRACDAQEYPSLSPAARVLKSASRRYTWDVDQRQDVPKKLRHLHRDQSKRGAR